MKKNTAILLIASFIGILLFGLGGFYIFFTTQQSQINTLAERRGFGEDPTFRGFLGSTFENLTGSSDQLQHSDPKTKKGDDPQSRPTTPRLWQVSKAPAAGVDLFGTSSTTNSIVFVDRATGHLFSGNLFTGSITRLTNTLIPNTHEAYWLDEDRVVLRSITEIGSVESILGTLTMATTTEESPGPGTFTGISLESDILTLITSKDLSEIFYLIHGGGGVVGIIVDEVGETPKRIFNSIIRGWRPEYGLGGDIILTQNTSFGIEGNAYIVTSGGNSTPLITSKPGLSVRSHPHEDKVLYSTIERGGLRLFVLDVSSETNQREVEISLRAFAEKCVWDPSEENIAYCAVPEDFPTTSYPDTWYRGEVHSSDRWWKINTDTNTVELLLAPESEYGVVLDILDPVMNTRGTHIGFLDAQTRTPWVLRIEP